MRFPPLFSRPCCWCAQGLTCLRPGVALTSLPRQRVVVLSVQRPPPPVLRRIPDHCTPPDGEHLGREEQEAAVAVQRLLDRHRLLGVQPRRLSARHRRLLHLRAGRHRVSPSGLSGVVVVVMSRTPPSFVVVFEGGGGG